MKLKFINFRRLGSDYPGPVDVPDALRRKPAFLSVLEIANALSAFVVAILSYSHFDSGNLIAGIAAVVLASLLFASAWATAMDKCWFRPVMSATYLLLAIGLLIAGIRAGSLILLLLVLLLVAIICALRFYQPVIAYHRWTKEIFNS